MAFKSDIELESSMFFLITPLMFRDNFNLVYHVFGTSSEGLTHFSVLFRGISPRLSRHAVVALVNSLCSGPYF